MANSLYEAARRAVPLPQLWQSYGHAVTRHGKRFASAFTPCCGEANRKDAGSLFMSREGEWKWHCFRCTKGGSAIDMVAKMDGISHKAAAQKLVADGGGFEVITGRPAPPKRPRVTSVARQEAIEKVIRAILNGNVAKRDAYAYLMQERGISQRTLNEAWDRGMLRALPGNPEAADTWLRLNVGEEVLLTSGLLKQRFPAAAYRPVVFLPAGGTSVEFRYGYRAKVDETSPKALQYGEQKWPLIWKPDGPVNRVVLVEGGIDLLSLVDLGMARDALVLGLLGVAAWQDRWIPAIQERYPEARWEVGFDADRSGEENAPQLMERLTAAGIQAERLLPWGGGKDWNDTLLAARAAF